MINGICKKCGRIIPVDETLDHFSCMYCGQRLSRADLLTEEKTDPDKSAGLFEGVMEKIASCVVDQRDIMKGFTRETYPASFKEYTKSCFRVFDELNSAVILWPEKREEYLDSAVLRLLDTVEGSWPTLDGWNTRKGKKAIMEKDKMVIALYLVPMVGKLALSISEDFSTKLQAEWVERFPKSPFYIGNYERINDSYYDSMTCFITTAVCRDTGKPDDCYELETLRRFRDGWLARTEEGRELIAEYYRIAPSIVTIMDLTGGDYRRLERDYIAPCIADIEAGRNEQCRDRYVRMVRSLEKRYLAQ